MMGQQSMLRPFVSRAPMSARQSAAGRVKDKRCREGEAGVGRAFPRAFRKDFCAPHSPGPCGHTAGRCLAMSPLSC